MKTYGFDYAYAITIAKINEALNANLSGVDIEIAYKTVDADSGSTITLNAKLAPWRITSGGQNSLLNVEIPFAQGVLELEGGAITGSYDLSDVSVVTQISLGWLGPGTPLQAQGDAGATQLVFDPTETGGASDPGYVAALVVHDPDGNLDSIATALLKAYVAAALVDNKAKLQYVFASINPVPDNLASWLRPTTWVYHYAETTTASALCFLCMMSDAASPQPAFDITALTPGSDCALLIAQPQFFRHVVLPGVQAAFPGGQFTLSSTDEVSTITNTSGFNVGSVSASSLRLTVSDQGDGLKVTASGGGPLKFLFGLANLPGASYSWSIASTNPLSFANGQLSFAHDPSPAITQDHEIQWYDWALLVVVGITDTAGLVSAIYDSIDNFHDEVQNAGIGTVNANVQAATGGATINLQNVVDWKLGNEQLALTEVQLSGALYARGKFQ
jgi:hypothetical protein